MPEREIPPPAGTLEYYRAEVGRRADVLGRRHRRRLVGATATAVVAVVAVGAVVATVRVTTPPGHVSASGASSGRGPHAGSASLRPPASTTTGSGGDATIPLAPAGSSSGANSAASGNMAPQNSAGGSQATVYDKPSGTVVTAGVNQSVLVVLAPTSGGWGRAVIGPGRHTVLTLVSQVAVGRVERLTFRTHGVGTATVAVPPNARSPAPWRLTIVVKAS